MTHVHIMATFYPAPGKVDRLRDLLVEQARQVYAKEDYAVRFLVTEQIKAESPEFCLVETYLSEEATSRHFAEPHFKQLLSAVEQEELVAQEMRVVKTVTIAGFEVDRHFQLVSPANDKL